MTEEDYRYRKSYIIPTMIFLFFLGFWLIYESFKTHENVEKITGIIIKKGIIEDVRKFKSKRYTFYFKLDNSNQNFGFFLGSGKNALKEGQSLIEYYKIGESITVYYDNNIITDHENITRLIYRIDYRGKISVNNNQLNRRIIGLILLGIGFVFLWMIFWLKKKYMKEKDLIGIYL